MDRLSTLARAAALLLCVGLVQACGGDGTTRSRVEGVRASGTPDPSRYWDTLWGGESAPRLDLPRVEPARPGTAIPKPPADRYVWVNLWATWCLPCRREMPLVTTFAERLKADGVPVDVWFVSIDESPVELGRFLADNPTVAPGHSLRVFSQPELGDWMKRLTSQPATAIPINLVAAPGGRLRAIRVGSLREGDYPQLRAAFR